MSQHDWGVSVPPELPTEDVLEIRDKLRAGTIEVEMPEHEKAEEWRNEFLTQMLAAYEAEAIRRHS